MAVDVGSAVGYLDLDISGFLANLRTAQSEGEKASGNLATKMGNGISGVGKSLTSVGTTLTTKVTTPLAALGGVVIKTSADFESSMSKVQAISGATGGDFDALKNKAREMGAKTKFSASESAEAFQYMAMAGWDVNSMMGGISGVMNLAAASGESLGTVSDIVTDAMTAFGLSAKETSKVLKDGVEVEVDNTTRFVDALAAASNSSNTNVSMLGESFKYVAPVAGALGYSVEDVAVALGLMANQGIKSSMAGTSLRTMLTNMSNPTDTMASAMQSLGVSLTDSEGNMKSLMEVMQDLRKGFGGGKMEAAEFEKEIDEIYSAWEDGKITGKEYEQAMQDVCVAMYGAEGAQKAQLAAQLAGKQGMAGLLAIVNSTDEDFQNLTDSIYNASGTSQEMADIMQNNLSGQLTILMSSLQELALQFGEIMMPYVKQFVEWIQQLVLKFQSMDEGQKRQIVKWAAIAAAIGPVILVVGKVVTAFGGIITTFGKIPGAITKLKGGFGLLKTAIGGVSAPVVAVIAAIATLVAAFKHLWDTNEEFRNNIIGIWNGIKQKFEEFAQGIVDRLNALGFDFENITEVIGAAWDAFCNLLAPVFEGVFSQIGNILSAALDVITGIFDIFIGLFTGNWEQVWDGVKGIFGAVWDFIKNTFQNWVNAFQGIADVILGWFGTSWEECWTNVKNFFTGIWNGIKSAVSTGLETIKTTFSTIWNAISGVITTVWNTIKNVVQVGIMFIGSIIKGAVQIITLPFRFIWENCKGIVVSVWNAIKSKITIVINGIKSVISTVWNTIKTNITTVVNAIKTVVTNVFNAVKTTASTVWNAIKTAITTPINAVKSTVSTVFNAVKSTISTVFNSIESTATSVWNNIKSAITTPINNAKTAVHDAIEAIKKKFNFQWSFPKLKLPHFSITGSFSLSPPSVPKLSIDWYAKAMGKGMIMNQPTIFGYNASSGKFLAGGEAGSEVVVGTQSLLSMIRQAVRESIDGITYSFGSYCAAMVDTFRMTSSNLVSIVKSFSDAYAYMQQSLEDIKHNLSDSLTTSRKVFDETLFSVQGTGFSYNKLLEMLREVIKELPPPEVVVQMEDGDVYMDAERVGRKLVPIISRITTHRG